MEIIQPSYQILSPMDHASIVRNLEAIELIGRKCYKSEDKIIEGGTSAIPFIRNLIKRGHEAMIEHSSLSVLFIVDRGVTHEMVRHRLASFAQESTRYCNYSGNGCTFIDIAGGIENDATMQQRYANFDEDAVAMKIRAIRNEWISAMADAEKHYDRMIELGCTPQIARSVLPNSTKTEIVITANYREWRAIFKLRADKPAHPQMRQVMCDLLLELKDRIPVIFDDIDAWYLPDYRQVEGPDPRSTTA